MRADADVLEQPFVLPADATLVPLAELSPRVRATLGPIEDEESQVAVSRPRFRVPTRLVSPELAALLGEFREPSLIADAVLRFSRARARDPFETLEDAFDALAVFINSSVLVPAGGASAEAVVATLAPGQDVSGYEIERLVSALEDTEVYLARMRAGRRVALKIARPEAHSSVGDGLTAESRILEHLGGGSSPALVELGSHDGRPFIAQEWASGVPVTAAAQRARARGDARRRLPGLCRAVLSAYAWLHERGVVHGDVHPGNVIVGDDGAVTIVDFGRSRLVAGATPAPEPERAGVAHFSEPELAEALLAEQLPPPATCLGEQYSLGALLYHLITGVHYVDFPPERDALLAHVVGRPPLPFTAHGLEPWPAVEAVLATALAKEPAERFAGVAELLAAFDQAAGERLPGRVAQSDAARRLVARSLARVAERGDAGPAGARELAWFALRAAQAHDDPELLAHADVWACRASAAAEPDWALAAVSADLHRARGDGAAQAHSAMVFLAACESAADRLDFLGGRSGALAASSGVLDGLRSADADAAPLTRWIRRTVEETWQTAGGWAPVRECRELPHLGMAHGWAGVLYATMGACRAARMPLPEGLAERLDELAELAQPNGRGLRWPGTIAHPGTVAHTPDLAPGWCSGSAGHALLWIRAHQELGEDWFLALAERAGRYAIDHPAANPDLCCGVTGRAFALLSLYQVTGDPEWLAGARRLAASAASAWPAHAEPLGLLKGPLGTALLLVELEEPETAVLPLLAA